MNLIGCRYCFLSSQLAVHQTESTEPAGKVFGKRHKARSIFHGWRLRLNIFHIWMYVKSVEVWGFFSFLFFLHFKLTRNNDGPDPVEKNQAVRSLLTSSFRQQTSCYGSTSSEVLKPFSTFLERLCRSSQPPWNPSSFSLPCPFSCILPFHLRISERSVVLLSTIRKAQVLRLHLYKPDSTPAFKAFRLDPPFVRKMLDLCCESENESKQKQFSFFMGGSMSLGGLCHSVALNQTPKFI